MSKQNLRTNEKKMAIIQEAKKNGVIVTVRKYKISTATLYEWKTLYESAVPSVSSINSKSTTQYRALQKENVRLKELLIDKELRIKIQEELLKKK